jgi:hypothetical protein
MPGKRIYVGITGAMQSGKDTLARAIEAAMPHGWHAPINHFADPLKEMARALLGGGRQHYWGTDEDKNQPLPTVWRERLGLGFATYRTALQFIGTEVFRAHAHPDFWVVAMQARIDALLEQFPQWDYAFLFPDVRFDNEARFLRSRGGLVVRVWRTDGKVGTSGIAGHASEAGISEDLVTHRYAIGPNGHASVARIVLDAAGVKP